MNTNKAKYSIENEAIAHAITQFGEENPISGTAEGKEFGGALARLAFEEEVIDNKIEQHAKVLMRINPGLTLEDALMWAEAKNEHPADYNDGREVTLKEAKALYAGRNTAKRMRMGPEQKRRIEEARKHAKTALENSPKAQKILREYERSLRDNDAMTAAFCYEEIEELGLNVSHIEERTPTELNLEEVKSGNVSLSGLS